MGGVELGHPWSVVSTRDTVEGGSELMGIGDKFDALKDKAKDVLGDHGDKVDQGVDKAGDFVDEKTGGKYSEQVDQGQQKAKEGLDRFGQR
jgi:hypothetical protein